VREGYNTYICRGRGRLVEASLGSGSNIFTDPRISIPLTTAKIIKNGTNTEGQLFGPGEAQAAARGECREASEVASSLATLGGRV
jgi:hypothetical protein